MIYVDVSDGIKPSNLIYQDQDLLENTMYELPVLNILKPNLFWHNGYIAGGCFKNIFSGERVKDLDIFFRNETDLNKALLYITRRKKQFSFVYQNEKCIAYYNNDTKTRIELITHMFLPPKDLIGGVFDFTIVKFAVEYEPVKIEGTHMFQNLISIDLKKDYPTDIDIEEISDNDIAKFSKEDFIDIIKNHNETTKTEESSDYVDANIPYIIKAIYHKDFFKDIMCKRLIIPNDYILFLNSTFDRISRYVSVYGYECPTETMHLIDKCVSVQPTAYFNDLKNNIPFSFYGAID